MAVSSTRRIIIRFTADADDIEFQSVNEATSDDSPSNTEIVELASGNNTITVPDGSIACTIVPPATNVDSEDPVNVQVDLTLKGVNGDTGIAIHPTDPTSIGLADGVSSFVIEASDTLANVRLIWS